MSKKWTEARVAALLARRYPAPAYAFMTQVRNATGMSGRETYADAVAMSCYPSRGMTIHGFEIKVSRQDWLKELAHPAKSEPVMQYCDHWWVVAPHGIIEEGEVPETWGQILAGPHRLKDIRKAPALSPKPIAREFVASMLRNATTGVVSEAIAKTEKLDALEQQRAELESHGSESEQMARVNAAHEKLLERVRDFETDTGLSVIQGLGWQDQRVGKILREIVWETGQGPQALKEKLLDLVKQREAAASRLREKVAEALGDS